MVQHSMEETSHLRDEEFDGPRARETPLDLVATVKSYKEENERLMRSKPDEVDLNVVLPKILSEIYNHLQ
jgi:hypothetical protein